MYIKILLFSNQKEKKALISNFLERKNSLKIITT